MAIVLWDSLGTLLDLEPVRAPFAAAGEAHGLEAWFERILHTGAALTLTGDFHPFAELAESTLPTVLAQLGLDPEYRAPLDALEHDLRPVAGAGAALDVLDEAGIPAWIVTNGGRESTERALARGGLDGRFAGLVSIDEVQSWKPAAPPYEHALHLADAPASEAWLVAAHAWDVRAARLHGLNAVWVDSLEHEWPLPGDPGERASALVEAARLVAGS
ncbi:MAG TPA: HAD family hydrolase [Gaiellaceae bacterium]|nr:HAD family hydrolase [Gaiellaceae bacterium]